MKISNAQIQHTTLGRESHNIFTCSLYMYFDSCGQSFGGYALDELVKGEHKRIGTSYGLQFIIKILETLEIDTWEKLKGTYCRIEHDNERIYRIGHLLKDQWFNPKEDLKDFS